MSIGKKLLSWIGQRNPAIFDVIPRGPESVLSHVALNPQPLPPAALGAAIASEFIRTAWQADRFGLDQGIAFRELDDWCPTGRPKIPKLPIWWPPIPDPPPHPDWFVDFHIGFAARLAVASKEVEGTQVGKTLDKAIDRSLAALDSLKT